MSYSEYEFFGVETSRTERELKTFSYNKLEGDGPKFVVKGLFTEDSQGEHTWIRLHDVDVSIEQMQLRGMMTKYFPMYSQLPFSKLDDVIDFLCEQLKKALGLGVPTAALEFEEAQLEHLRSLKRDARYIKNDTQEEGQPHSKINRQVG